MAFLLPRRRSLMTESRIDGVKVHANLTIWTFYKVRERGENAWVGRLKGCVL